MNFDKDSKSDFFLFFVGEGGGGGALKPKQYARRSNDVKYKYNKLSFSDSSDILFKSLFQCKKSKSQKKSNSIKKLQNRCMFKSKLIHLHLSL